MREMQKNEENMEEKKNTKKLQWSPYQITFVNIYNIKTSQD